jgi:hypothetical protein
LCCFQTSLEAKLSESREANQLLGKLLRDSQNEKRVLEGRLQEQGKKLQERTEQLERKDIRQIK